MPKPSLTFAPQPNQPKKPSPLSQSFSATEDSSASRQTKPTHSSSQTLQATTDVFRKSQTAPLSSEVSASTIVEKQPTPQPSKEEMLHRLAREATLDVDTGFIRQYVEFYARQTILSVYDELYTESLQQLADNFRAETLASRFGRRWRDICWRRRLVRRGRERRKRSRKNQEAKELEKTLAAETNAVDTFLQSMQGKKVNTRKQTWDPTSTAQRRTSEAKSPNDHATERPFSPEHSIRNSTTTNGDHVDSSGRISKSAVSSTPARSSYLSFSTHGATGNSSIQKKSARSSYFRLRALGIDPNAEAVPTPLARKRARDESEEAAAEMSPAAHKSRTPPHSAMNGVGNGTFSAHRRSISIDRPRSKIEEEDEALFARARAARQALSDSAAWYRSEVENDENQQRREMARSLETSSMQRAREAARLRASQSSLGFRGSITNSGPASRVPAYRFRESKFVPREQYGKAVVKAKYMVEARSRSPVQMHPQPDGQSGSPAARRSAFPSQTHGRSDPMPPAHPALTSQADTVTQDMFGNQDKMQSYSSLLTAQGFSQGMTMSGDYTVGNETAIAEALYRTMMQPSQEYPNHVEPNDAAPAETLDNGLENNQSLVEPNMQDWVNEEDNRMDHSAHPIEYMEDEDEDRYGGEDEGGFAQRQDYYGDEEEELYDEEGEEDEEGFEEEEEEEYDEDEDELEDESEGGGISGSSYPQPQQALKGQPSAASTIKAGTGTQEDAFELSD